MDSPREYESLAIRRVEMLLTDEENPYNDLGGREREEDGILSKYEIFEAGAKTQLKKMVEWGDEKCPHIIDLEEHGTMELPRRACVRCWRVLKEEVGVA